MATAGLGTSKGDQEPAGTVLQVGVPFNYTVPSFAVFSAVLRQVTLEMIVNGQKVVDGFIRDDPSVNRALPACITVAKHCFVDVSSS